jgi:3-dehydroquinate dehydratase / shikimate dehydrogenase
MSVGPDRVCAVVARTRHKMMQIELAEAAKVARFLEVRLDFLNKAVDFKRLQPFKKCDWLATIRRPADGGRWAAAEEERLMVLRQAIVSGCFDWIDLETDIADGIRRFGSVKRVISYHNLIETPAELDEIYAKMLQQDGDVYKIAVMPRTATDLARIIAIQKRAPKPTICFGMGDFGFPTRFLALKFGCPWIYAMFNKDRELAPGMPAISDFRTTYPIRSINDETRFFALLGDPVGHSFSPILHNHLFQRNKVNAIYLPLRVPEGHVKETVAALNAVPMAGYSVTIPHKQAAVAQAADADPIVTQVGAANTLVYRSEGTFSAANTDYPAALEALRLHLDERAVGQNVAPREFAQTHVLVLGAGGAARAIAFALFRAGAQVTISARTAGSAKRLADDVGCKHTEWAARHNVTPCDVAINCTPVGMHPNVNESPLHVSFLRPDLTIFDTVYNPEQTLLIREAKSRGCGTVNGVDMFVRQAAKQFELFTGISPDLESMRELLRKAMSPLTKVMNEEAIKSGMAEQTEPSS